MSNQTQQFVSNPSVVLNQVIPGQNQNNNEKFNDLLKVLKVPIPVLCHKKKEKKDPYDDLLKIRPWESKVACQILRINAQTMEHTIRNRSLTKAQMDLLSGMSEDQNDEIMQVETNGYQISQSFMSGAMPLLIPH